jgi:predicted ribosome quality control (RQC) complex YloA/Tae2 family protein
MTIKGSYHQHYHFIKQLAPAINNWLAKAIFINAYTLSKEELVLLFQKDNQTFQVKVIAKFQTGFLLFNQDAFIKGSNTQSCFQSLINQEVLEIKVHSFNRSFSIYFNNKAQLIFKCYDALINVILVENEEVVDLFRENIQKDWKYTKEEFEETNQDFIKKLDAETCQEGTFWIYQAEQCSLLTLSPNPLQSLIMQTHNPLEASTIFAKNTLNAFSFNFAKNAKLVSLNNEIKKLHKQIKLTKQAISNGLNQSSFEEIGHIIMANLHTIIQGDKEVELFNFYNNQNILITLKPNLSPAENAAYYYRREKNRKIEADLLIQKSDTLQKKLVLLESTRQQVEEATQNKHLKIYQKENRQQPVLPFKKFIFDNFEIWVGKNAANNDLLTQKYAHKNDIWLHAKDVTGSHVIIKHRAGKVITPQLLIYAAKIAAYYSKHKGSSLAPVSYTPKKYVRKPKGFLPGQVVIDREEVIMVEPVLPKD